MDGLLGTLAAAGFDAETTYHVYHLIDGYIFGFTLWEIAYTTIPLDAEAVSRLMRDDPVGRIPASGRAPRPARDRRAAPRSELVRGRSRPDPQRVARDARLRRLLIECDARSGIRASIITLIASRSFIAR